MFIVRKGCLSNYLITHLPVLQVVTPEHSTSALTVLKNIKTESLN